MMAEQPASKPSHVIATQRTKLLQGPPPSCSSSKLFCGGFEFMTCNSPFSHFDNSATFGYASALFSQALDGRTDAQRKSGHRCQWHCPGACLRWTWGRAIAVSDTRLTNDEAPRISKLIARLPELVELEKDRNKNRYHVDGTGSARFNVLGM